MSKKIKKQIIRIAVAVVLFGTALAVERILAGRLADGGNGASVAKYAAPALYFSAYLVIGLKVLKSAIMNCIHGRLLDENFLMTIASIGAIVCGEYSEAVAVFILYEIGETFQSAAVAKSRKSINALMDIRPDFARVLEAKDGASADEVLKDPSEVNKGDLIVVRPGDRVPLDGIVIDGRTTLDTSAITGESMPTEAGAGERVVSGCVNLSGVITLEVTGDFSESTVSRILELVEDAASKKANSEKFITGFSRVYTPIVVGLALTLAVIGTIVTGNWQMWIYRAMSFLLISCPCALVISVPLAFFGGIGGAGKAGILIKGGNYIETLSRATTLVLDKTGTITKGNFEVVECVAGDYFKENFPDWDETKILEFAAMVECHSTHPIATSIVRKYTQTISDGNENHEASLAKADIAGNADSACNCIDAKTFGKNVKDITEIAGKGVSATIDDLAVSVGNAKLVKDIQNKSDIETVEGIEHKNASGTIVYVTLNGRLIGYIRIEDEIKENAAEAVSKCIESGIERIVMLTGDNQTTAEIIAKKAGIKEVHSQLSPVDKVSELERIIDEKRAGSVVFVGDGINDAPVLMRADLGIAMGGIGSDAAIEAADVVIMTDDLAKIPVAKRHAVKTLKIVRENIVGALAVKVIVLILSAFGVTTMWAAIFADVGVAALAVMNAMRALKVSK